MARSCIERKAQGHSPQVPIWMAAVRAFALRGSCRSGATEAVGLLSRRFGSCGGLWRRSNVHDAKSGVGRIRSVVRRFIVRGTIGTAAQRLAGAFRSNHPFSHVSAKIEHQLLALIACGNKITHLAQQR